MDLGFITWWFDRHWFWSTLLTPGMTLAWCFYKGLLWRGIIAGILTAVLIGKTSPCKCWDRGKCEEKKGEGQG